jgi:hypothetical protein
METNVLAMTDEERIELIKEVAEEMKSGGDKNKKEIPDSTVLELVDAGLGEIQTLSKFDQAIKDYMKAGK